MVPIGKSLGLRRNEGLSQRRSDFLFVSLAKEVQLEGSIYRVMGEYGREKGEAEGEDTCREAVSAEMGLVEDERWT